MLFQSWSAVAENSGMAAGFAKLPSQRENSHYSCLHLPRTEGANTAIILGAEDQIFYGYGTLGDSFQNGKWQTGICAFA